MLISMTALGACGSFLMMRGPHDALGSDRAAGSAAQSPGLAGALAAPARTDGDAYGGAADGSGNAAGPSGVAALVARGAAQSLSAIPSGPACRAAGQLVLLAGCPRAVGEPVA